MRVLHEALELSSARLDKEVIAICLDRYAAVAASIGDGERSATLLGAAEQLRRETGEAPQPTEPITTGTEDQEQVA